MRVLSLGLVLGLAAAVEAEAHPDIAVTARLLFDVRAGRLAMVAESLAFDAGHSRRLLERFDRDGDGRFDEGEADSLRRSLAADLAPLGYFTELRHNGRPVALPAPSGFHATGEGGLVTVTFAFGFDQPLDLGEGQSVDLLLRDRDYTAAFALAPQMPVVIRGDEGRCAYARTSRPDLAFFGGMVVPEVTTLTCR